MAESADASESVGSVECGWLVHNAGGVDRAGHRLAALGQALTQHGMEVDPIDMATNVVTRAGDFGQARAVGLLTVAIAQSAAVQLPALCAEFGSDDTLATFFVRQPPQGAA